MIIPLLALKAQIISGALYFKGPVVSKYLTGGKARIYAPSTYDADRALLILTKSLTKITDGLNDTLY